MTRLISRSDLAGASTWLSASARLNFAAWLRKPTLGFALNTFSSPAVTVQIGETSYYLNDIGVVLDPATEAGQLPVVNRPDFGAVKRGQHAVAGELLPMLLKLRAGFNPAFKISVMAFNLD